MLSAQDSRRSLQTVLRTTLVAAIWCKDKNTVPKERHILVMDNTTNNIAELHAVNIVINLLMANRSQEILSTQNKEHVFIYSDSKYTIAALTGNKANKNVKLIDFMLHMLGLLRLYYNIHFVHVKAHNNDPYNEHADQLAKHAVQRYRNKQDIFCLHNTLTPY